MGSDIRITAELLPTDEAMDKFETQLNLISADMAAAQVTGESLGFEQGAVLELLLTGMLKALPRVREFMAQEQAKLAANRKRGLIVFVDG